MRYKIAKSDFFILSQGGTLSLYDFRCPGIHARPREAPGLSAGSLQVARRQVTLKPPTSTITPQRKRPPPADGGLDHCGGAGCYSAAIRSACAVRSMM